jgi:glutaredoxin 3
MSAMQPITIYTTRFCPYCTAAKDLLRKKSAAFSEIDVTGDRDGRAAMVRRAGGRTSVPQIFVGDTHIGGCDDLYALDADGRLDPLLAA